MSEFYKIAPSDILVVLDDLALPLGRIRIRPTGGAGGHNGLESIIINLAQRNFPDCALGSGRRPERGSVDYVLWRFFEEERSAVAIDDRTRGRSDQMRN